MIQLIEGYVINSKGLLTNRLDFQVQLN